jgi:N-acetylneuraminic acid mutarotase
LFVAIPLLACPLLAWAETPNPMPNPMPYPPMPEAVTSFGATVAGDFVYIFGGHMGRMPGNSADGLSPHFSRLSLANPQTGWEPLPMRQSSQSPGLVAWNGQVYRVGGLSFQNKAGEPTIYESLAVFARFHPETSSWTELPSLPLPRSSLDAAVVDGRLYVVGGWNLQGTSAQSGEWHEDALVFDLANEAGDWKPIARPPFQTRALAAAAHNHKLYVLGGMKSSNQTTRDVHIYDPQTDQWSAGPELKSNNQFGGFAIAAFATGGRLYYSGGDGTVYGLNETGDAWENAERLLFPRMFHRMVPIAEHQLAVLGGTSVGAYQASLEVVDVGSSPVAAKLKSVQWTVSFPGTARHSQTLIVHNGSLYAFGGNNSPRPHDFAPTNFVDEAFRFDLASRTVETLQTLPQPMQSGAAVVVGRRIDQSIYLLGGLSPQEDQFSSTAVIQQYRLRSQGWSDELQQLPASRAMFQAAVHGGSVWMFGGAQSGTAGRGLVSETWSWNPVAEEPVQPVPDAALPVLSRSFGGAVLRDRFYAVGGLGETNEIVSRAQVFDFATKTWSEIPAPKYPRVFPSLAASGGKLYLAGGFTRVDGHFAGTTSIEVFDPETQTWTTTFEELAPTLAEMSMLEFQDRLLFYNVDRDKPGHAHFLLLDPTPHAPGQPAIAMDREDRSAATDLVARLMRLDKNRDGALSADEVGERFLPIVEQADANRDGVATRQEIEAYAEQQEAGGSNRPAPR